MSLEKKIEGKCEKSKFSTLEPNVIIHFRDSQTEQLLK